MPLRADEVTINSTLLNTKEVGIMKDENETKEQLISELEDSQEQLHTIFESVSDGVAVSDLELRITDINETGLRMFGYDDKEKLIGQSGLELISPKDHARAMVEMRSTLEQGHSGTLEYTFLDKKGREFLAEYSVMVIKDESGKPVGFVATMKDITERKQADETLRESEEFSSSLLTNSPIPMLVINPDTSVKYVNPALEELTGFSFAEVIGRKAPYLWWTEETLRKTRADLREAMRHGAVRLEELFKKKSGERFWVEVTSTPIIHNGEYKYYLANWVDITERKQVEERLEENEREKTAILESMDDVVIYQDADMRVLWANRTAAESVNSSMDELIGQHCYEIWHGSTEPCIGCPVILAKEKLKPQSAEMVTPDGRQWFVRGYPVQDKDGHITGIVEVTTDITERKQAEEELRQSELKYRELLESLQEGIWVIDKNANTTYVNQPMADMLGYFTEEMVAKHLFSFMDENGVKIASQLLERRQHGVKEQHEFEFIRKNGTRIYTLMETSPLTDDKGAYLGAIAGIIDITERKKMEETLREARDKAKKYLDIAGVILVAIDSEGKVTLINRKGGEVLGYEEEEVIGKNWFDNFIPPRIKDDVLPISKALLSGQIEPVEYYENPVLTRSGEERTIAWQNTVLRNDQGNITGHLSSGEDITERKKMEETLRESEERFRIASQIASDVVYERDLQTGIATFYGDIDSHLGYEPGEYPRTMEGWREHVHPEDLTWFDRQSIDQLEPGVIHSTEYRMRKNDGTYMTWWDRIILIRDEKTGKPVKFIGAATDITERKRAEEALTDEATRRRILVDQSRDGIVVLDQDGQVYEVNKRFAEMIGYTMEEALQLNVWDWEYLYPPEQVAEMIRTVDEKGDHFETKHRRKDGSIYDVEISTNAAVFGGQKLIFCVCRDITERKQLEELYITLARNSPIGVYIFQEGKYRFVNHQFVQATGYSEDELVKMEPGQLVHHEDREAAREAATKMLKGERTSPYEFRVYNRDGGIRWAMETVSSIYYEGKRATLGNFIDITERKQSELEYKTIIQTAIDGFWLLDTQGRFLDVNDAYCKLIGYSRDELLQMSIPDIEAVEKPKEITSRIAKIMETGGDRFETRHRRKDGKTIDVEVSVNLIDAGGGRMCVFIRNITERKQSEEKIRESEENFRHSLDNSPLGIRIVTAEGDLLYANQAILDIYGYSNFEELKNTPIKQRFTPESYVEHQKRAKERKRGKPVPENYEIGIIRNDGEVRYLQVFHRAVIWNGKIEFQSIYQDITERKQLETERQRIEKLESLGTLAAGIAHDFNNLLTGIMGNISLAKRHVETGGKARERLEGAEKASVRARDLTRQLLTFAKGGTPIKRTISMSKLIEESATFALRGSRARPEFSLPDNLWTVEADEGQINQVINNIVINADQAMPQGGIINIEAKNRVITSRTTLPLPNGNYVEIVIKDQGIGIPKEHLSSIFDPFFTSKKKGSGLGLATTYSIVKNHGGYITVKSEPSAGTSFHVYLPVGKKPAAVKEEIPEETALVGKGKILIMDDEESIRELLYAELTECGYDVELVNDGAEAITKYNEAKEAGQQFDVVILDLTVPGGIGGKETITKLLEIDPEVKAIVSSGYATDPIMSEYKKHGFSAVVSKPYNVSQLEKTLHGSLAKKK
jgi:PAS domain S-box-containing protein